MKTYRAPEAVFVDISTKESVMTYCMGISWVYYGGSFMGEECQGSISERYSGGDQCFINDFAS